MCSLGETMIGLIRQARTRWDLLSAPDLTKSLDRNIAGDRLIDLSGLKVRLAHVPDDEAGVLNGIAYDAPGDRLFVMWPGVFEIRRHPLDESQ
ncbi:MAG: glutaminyl-peptide cyclotransferase [Acidobacteria bacterium]|nr:glutaminyl-peptide cyclotransferase [Acidobacteriota bacterium]